MDLFDELRQLTLVVTGISKRLHVDRRQEVPDALRHMLTLVPKASISKMRPNFRHQWMRDLLFDGLRQAGLPE